MNLLHASYHTIVVCYTYIMITKEQYLSSLSNEFRIIKHLAGKVSPQQLTHKPTEKQRTLHELLHYLTHIFIAGADSVVTGDGDAWKKYSGGEAPKLGDFSQMMDSQEAHVKELVSSLSEDQMKEEVHMWGRTQSRAMHLLGLLNIAVAYKMQLFLYLKQSGTENINTMNLWAGMDQPPQM
jgi:hypothetical protein